MTVRFAKYQGLGNDFLLVDEPVSPAAAARLCDRRFGVGADGVIVVTAEPAMKVYNADGSTPEMCGNGLRCVALHLALARGFERGDVTVRTDAGPRTCYVARNGTQASVRVDMGAVRLDGTRSLEVAGKTLTVDLADVGNPHAVLWGVWDDGALVSLGPSIATHPSFPNGTNVELATLREREGRIDVVVWERGVGPTLACGTGACAVAAVAVDKGLVDAGKAVRVALPGGVLEIEPGPTTFMTGPACLVFRGETDAP